MAQQTMIPPNYHEFGPSRMETELAQIAAAGNEGFGNDRALNMLGAAHGQRMSDNADYRDMLNSENATRLSELHQSGINEFIKAVVPGLVREGQPIGPGLRFLMSGDYIHPSDTSMLAPSDRSADINQLSKAFQAYMTGVNQGREGGQGTDAAKTAQLFGPGFGNVDPTKVEAEKARVAKENEPMLTINGKNFGMGADGAQLRIKASQYPGFVQQNPAVMRSEFGDHWNTFQGLGQGGGAGPGAGPGADLGTPPPVASGMHTDPSAGAVNMPAPLGGQAPQVNAGADANILPQMNDAYNTMIGTAPKLGDTIGQSQRQNDGSVIFPFANKKTGKTGRVRIYNDHGTYRLRREQDN